MSTDTVWANTTLSAVAQRLQPLDVETTPKVPRGAGLEGFADRQRMGFGTFIEGEALRQEEHLRLHEVLLRHAGIALGGSGLSGSDPGGPVYAVGSRVHRTTAPCFMQVLVDGVPFRGTPAPDLKHDLTVSEIEAIEVYKGGAATPMEFGGTTAQCGSIVIWTRRSQGNP